MVQGLRLIGTARHHSFHEIQVLTVQLMTKFFETIEERLDRLERDNRKLRSKVDGQESLLFELQRKVYFLRQRELQRQIDDYLENFTPLSERKKQQKQ